MGKGRGDKEARREKANARRKAAELERIREAEGAARKDRAEAGCVQMAAEGAVSLFRAPGLPPLSETGLAVARGVAGLDRIERIRAE